MGYPRCPAAGLPVGSGVVEGACRSVVRERFRKSGLFWSVKGANRVLALRCAVESNTFDDFGNTGQSRKMRPENIFDPQPRKSWGRV